MNNFQKITTWLRNKGIARKYNPHHMPKGTPQGGQFASSGSGGKSGPPATAGFKNKDEAETWIYKNLAYKVEFGDLNIKEINSMLATVKHIQTTCNNLPKLDALNLSASPSFMNGCLGIFVNRLNRLAIRQGLNTKETNATGKDNITAKIETIRAKVDSHKLWAEKHPEQADWPGNKEYLAKLEKELSKTEKGGKRSVSKMAVTDGGADGTLTHEFGHAWHHSNRTVVEKELGLSYDGRETPSKKLVTTQYSKTNHAECFAEAFTLYHAGRVDTLDKKVVKFFDKHFSKLNYGDTAT